MKNEINRRDEFDEDLIRKYLSLIDLEEFKLSENNYNNRLQINNLLRTIKPPQFKTVNDFAK